MKGAANRADIARLVYPGLLALTALFVLRATRPCGAADGGRLAEFDIRYEQERVRKLIVPVTIRGNVYQFVIDTGSGRTTFGLPLRPLLGTPTGTSRSRLVTGTEPRLNYRAPRCAVGPLDLPPLDEVTCREVCGGAGSIANEVDGVLGMDALSGTVLQVDFDRGKISFLREVPPNAGTPFPWVIEGPLPTVYVAIEGYGNRTFLVDTGFDGEVALANVDFANLVSRQQLLSAGSDTGRSFAKTFESRFGGLATRLSLGSYAHGSLACMELPKNDWPIEFSLFGVEYLSRYVVTFDPPHHVVYLRPSVSFAALRPSAGLGGVRIGRVGPNVVVVSVKEQSPAAAQAHVNDVMETINGMPVATLSDAEVVRLLSDASKDRKMNFRRPVEGTTWYISLPGSPPSLEAAPRDHDTPHLAPPTAQSPAKAPRRRLLWRR